MLRNYDPSLLHGVVSRCYADLESDRRSDSFWETKIVNNTFNKCNSVTQELLLDCDPFKCLTADHSPS
uniref:RNA-directed RNA polymerase n=1 Tax=Steinernema glaseri TaxID=37863 RepID=A0A1I8AKB0_9BILA